MPAAYAELGLIGVRSGWPIEWVQSVWGRLSPAEKDQGSTLSIEWEEGDGLREYCLGRDAGDPLDQIPGVSATFAFSLVGHGGYGRQSFAGSVWPSLEGTFLISGVHAQGDELQEDWFRLVARLSVDWFFDEDAKFLTFGFADDLGTYKRPGLLSVYPSTKRMPASRADFEKLGMVLEVDRNVLLVWSQTVQAFLESRTLSEDVLRLMDLLREGED